MNCKTGFLGPEEIVSLTVTSYATWHIFFETERWITVNNKAHALHAGGPHFNP